jgi:hypothetical protein
MAAVATLVGIALYAALFSAYHRFYSILGLQPEDVGVSYVFLLTRSIAFTLVVGVPVAYLITIGHALAEAGSASRWRTIGKWLVVIAVNFYAAYLIRDLSVVGAHYAPYVITVWGVAFAAVAISLIVIGTWAIPDVLQVRGAPVRRFVVLTVLVATGGFIAFTGGLAHAAAALAHTAERGFVATPLRIFGFPLLEVEASPVRLEWVGAHSQRPSELFAQVEPLCLLLIGQSPSTVYVASPLNGRDAVSDGRVFRLPVEFVTLSTAADCDPLQS